MLRRSRKHEGAFENFATIKARCTTMAFIIPDTAAVAAPEHEFRKIEALAGAVYQTGEVRERLLPEARCLFVFEASRC